MDFERAAKLRDQVVKLRAQLEGESEEDVNGLFADFVRAHPGLRELWIPWNPGIQDLTPLLGLEELQYVRVSADMKEAIASLDGKGIHFDFEIEGQ